MTITEFLEARIAEDEVEAKWVEAEGDNGSSTIQHPSRILAECAAKRAIIGMHRGESWTVPQQPYEDPYRYIIRSDDPDVLVKLGGDTVEKISTEEYFKRMGATKNPPAAELRALAAVYASHPDYQQEWAL